MIRLRVRRVVEPEAKPEHELGGKSEVKGERKEGK